MNLNDVAKRLDDKLKFSTFGRLKKDIRRLDANQLSTGEFRQKWNKHFASREHIEHCKCFGSFCPFEMARNEKTKSNEEDL